MYVLGTYLLGNVGSCGQTQYAGHAHCSQFAVAIVLGIGLHGLQIRKLSNKIHHLLLL